MRLSSTRNPNCRHCSALWRGCPRRPAAATHTHNHIHLGTLLLMAVLNLDTGKVYYACTS